jgi:hypothetical protein
MRRLVKFLIGAALALPAGVALMLTSPVTAQAQAALGPEGRVYAVETREGRYTAQFRRGGSYQDSRPRSGFWQFDGRTLCVLFQAASRTEPEYEICKPYRELAVGESYETLAWNADGSPARITRVE